MSYTIDSNDEDAIVFSGHSEGIASSPQEGISDMRNVNIVPIPGEASVNFAMSSITYGNAYGTITSADTGADTITFTFTSGTLADIGVAIVISGTNLPAGITAGIPYWVASTTSPTQLYSNYARTSLVDITTSGTPGNWTWTTLNMGIPKYYQFDGTYYWMIDSNGYVWSNANPTTNNSYWTHAGNRTSPYSHGNGLGFYQGSGFGYIFAFSDSSIDYTRVSPLSNVSWVYQWNIAAGTVGAYSTNPAQNLKTAPGFNNNHESIIGTDNRNYFTDANYVGSFYQTAPGTAFLPTDITTYTYNTTAIMPFTEIGQCLAQSGTNLLVGGKKNVIYPWDRFSTTNNYPIFIAESNIVKMVTVNTNTYILAGNRGRVYVTNGSQAQLFKKLPDHLSGVVEPYYTWGGLASNKNQLYFSALLSTNAGVSITTMGGIWAIDLASQTQAIRMINQLSYETGVGAGTGNYAGYASALIPNFSTLPAGTGLYAGWTSSGSASVTGRTVTNGVLNSTTTITSATAAFTSADLGSAVTGVGIPPLTSIITITSSTSIVLSNAATATATGVTINIATNGIDQSSSSPYTGSQAYIDYDFVPVATFLRKKTFKTVEYKLSVPMVTNESVSIYYRLNFNDTYTLVFTSNGTTSNGSISDNNPVNFENVQWIQLRAVLNSTASSPSFTRLTEVRIK